MENLLARVGQKVGLDLGSLLKNGSWIFLKFLVIALGGWVLSLMFAHLGTKTLLGEYQYVIAVITLLSLCSLPGLNTAAFEAVAQGREAAIIKAVKWSLALSWIALPLFAVWGWYNADLKGQSAVGETLIIAGFLAPFFYAFNTWNIYFDGKSLFKPSALRTIVVNIAVSVALALGLLAGLNLLGLVLIYLLVQTAFFGYYFWEVVQRITDFKNDALDFTFGVNSSIQRFVFSLSNNIPSIAITFLFGAEAVAVYYVGYFVFNAALSLLGMLGYLYIPGLFKGMRIDHRRVILQNLCVGVFLWAAFLVFLQFLFIPMYGKAYAESQELAYRLSFLMLLLPLKVFLMNFFMTAKKNWTIIWTVALANGVALLLFFVSRRAGFLPSTALYLYSLELLTTFPLFFIYLRGNVFNPVQKTYDV